MMGIDLSLSTLADLVGACTTAPQPLCVPIERHVLAAARPALIEHPFDEGGCHTIREQTLRSKRT